MRLVGKQCIVKANGKETTMGMTVKCTGDLKKTKQFLYRLQNKDFMSILHDYALKGVEALKQATPVDTGETASCWYYEITKDHNRATINWCNTNVNKGVVIALLIQYGHGTGKGGYVYPVDYINPAIVPIFEDLANKCWKEVSEL